MYKVLISISIILMSLNLSAQGKELRILNKAYNSQSQTLLTQFFQNWNTEIPEVSSLELATLSDKENDVYKVFKPFYSPNNLKRSGASEFGEINENTNYWLVQNTIRAFVTEKIYFTKDENDSVALANIFKTYNVSESDTANVNLWKRRYYEDPEKLKHWISIYKQERVETFLFELNDFRPNIEPASRVLFLSQKYENILADFLGEIDNSKNSVADKKANFIKNQIFISEGLFKDWHILTYPSVSKITFDANFEYAEIEFQILHEGGEAMMKKEDGKWNLVSSKRTWIE